MARKPPPKNVDYGTPEYDAYRKELRELGPINSNEKAAALGEIQKKYLGIDFALLREK